MISWRNWGTEQIVMRAQHREIIARFDRFPHRNETLGHESRFDTNFTRRYHDHRLLSSQTGEIRTHGAVILTTVFEFEDSRVGACRPITKRVV